MKAECAAAREWLLEADLAELRDGGGLHGQHVRNCAQCRAAAQVLLDAHQQLNSALNTLVPDTNAARFRARRWLFWTVPLTAAAALALLLLRGDDTPKQPSPLIAQSLSQQTPLVTPPVGKQAIIMEKPDLTVVWLY